MTTETKRAISFGQAKRDYPHRFTMEHVPDWATKKREDGTYYAPQYRTDLEWFNNTAFPGEEGRYRGLYENSCESSGHTWPLGKSLPEPYRIGQAVASRRRATVEDAENKAVAIQTAYLNAVHAHNEAGMRDLEALVRDTLLAQESNAQSFSMSMGIWGFYDGEGKRIATSHKAFKAVASFMGRVGGTLPGFTGNPIRIDLVDGDIIKRKEW